MPVGTNFDYDSFPVEDRDFSEKYLVSQNFLSAYNEDGYFLTLEKHYRIYASDFVPLCLYQPRKGYTHQIITEDGYIEDNTTFDFYILYEVLNCKIERVGDPITRRGRTVINVKVTLNLCPISDPTRYERGTDPYIDPWDRPPYNFKIGTSLTRHYATDYFNTVANVRAPLVNTAGVPLQVNLTRPLTRISFSFNTPDIPIENSLRKNGCVNNDRVLICGIWFYPYEVKLESIRVEQAQEIHIYQENDQIVTETVNYFKNDVVLLADPITYNRAYLNAGMHVKKYGGVHRLWSGLNSSNQTVYGTLEELLNLGISNPQEVTTNLYLNSAGTGLNFVNDAIEANFLYGVVEEVTPFNLLFGTFGLPQEPPFIWNRIIHTEPTEP